jgi:phosphatidylglycerophosphate synthase
LSRLRRSRKPRLRQEALCELIFRPLAHLVVVALAPLRVPPPVVVLGGAACGLAGAVELGRGQLVAAALLVQLKTVLDNADGQLARLTGRVTAFGRYLDAECDLVVDAALFAGLGWYAHRPLTAALGFVALTAVLSVNFNVERIARGAPPSWDGSALGRAYGVLYGWQDRLADRVFTRVHLWQVGTLANVGLSTQLAVFGICLAAGRPVAFVWVLAVELLAVAALFVTPLNREVSLEHR